MSRALASSIGLVLLAPVFMLATVMASCAQPHQPMIEASPTSSTLVTGQTMQLVVTRRFPAGPVEVVTDRVSYASTNRNVAMVSDLGRITAGTESGLVAIRVLDPLSDAVATVSVDVVPPRIAAIEVEPAPAAVMSPGARRRFSAMARLNNGLTKDVTNEVIWASSNEAAASVGHTSADFGLVTAVAEGDATISATDSATDVQGRSIVYVRGEAPQLRAVRITPNPAVFGVGQILQLSAAGVFTDGTERDLTSSVTWSSAVDAVVRVDEKGLATGVAAGDATITAVAGEAGTGDAGPPASATPVRGSAAVKVQPKAQ